MPKAKPKKSPAKAAGKSNAARPANASAKTQQSKTAPIIGQWPFVGATPTQNAEMFTMKQQNPFSSMFGQMPQFDMNQMMPDMTKSMQDAQNWMQECMAAQKKAAEAMQSRWDSVLKTTSTKAQNMNARSQQAAKELMGCKTFSEFAEKQKQLMQDQMEDVMATATMMSETCTKMMQEAAEPMANQMAAVMSKMSKSA